MEDILKEALREDEQLLWSGRPEPFETLDKTHKKPFIRSTILTAVVTLAICLAYILYAGSRNVDVKIGVPIVVAACGIFIILRGLMDASKLKKGVLYAITDKRLFVVMDSARAVEYSSIHEARFCTDEDGHTSLLCGDRGVKAKPHSCRAAVLTGVCTDSDTGLCENFAMYAIPDAGKVKTILKQYLPL